MNQDAIQPVGVRITKDGKRAFVALGPANRVAVIDTATFKVERYLLVGQRVWQLAFTPDEKLLFTTNGTSNDVSVIDVERLRVTALDQGRALSVGRCRRAVLSAAAAASREISRRSIPCACCPDLLLAIVLIAAPALALAEGDLRCKAARSCPTWCWASARRATACRRRTSPSPPARPIA